MATVFEAADDVYASSKMKKSESVVLKVQINCNCCARKVRKAIGQVEGVESIAVDIKQKKVTVTGSFDSSKVVKQVAKKTGKNVEVAGSNKDSKNALDKGKDKVKSSIQQQHQDHQHEQQMKDQASAAFALDYFSDDNPNGCSIM